MNDSMHLLLALIFGFAIGIFYFSSLWITVRQLPTTQQPIPLIIGSLLGRLSIAVLGFYSVMHGSWQRLLIALLGFVLARTILIKRWKPKTFLNNL